MTMPKISTHLGYFGGGSDRYNPAGYQDGASPVERIGLASQVDGLAGVELNYPALVKEETVDEVRSVLREAGLAVSNVSLNLWGASKWAMGSLKRPSRKPAIGFGRRLWCLGRLILIGKGEYLCIIIRSH